MMVYGSYQANALKVVPIKKWEYWNTFYDNESPDKYDKLGQGGWELVAAVPETDIQSSGCTCINIHSRTIIRLFFKRECN